MCSERLRVIWEATRVFHFLAAASVTMEEAPVVSPLPVDPPLPMSMDSYSSSSLMEKKSYVSAVQNKQVLVNHEVPVEISLKCRFRFGMIFYRGSS